MNSVHRYDYSPWLFWTEATADERRVQESHHADLAAGYDVRGAIHLTAPAVASFDAA